MDPNPRPTEPDFAAAYATQNRLFLSRLTGHENELSQLKEAAKQTKIQAEGTAAQHGAVLDQIAIVADEVARQLELETKNLTTTRLVAGAKRQEADLKGRAGHLIAEMGRLKSRAAQMEIERSRLMGARKEQAIENLADLSVQLRDANSRLVAAKRRLLRLNIVAPVSGIIFDLQVHAVRSVVGSGEPLAYVIPQDRALIVTARISESDIDQLSFNQHVNLRFSALDTRFTPTIRGQVERISADILGDEVTGLRFYEADIRPNAADFDLLGDQKLVPGMPVEAYIQTGDRTPLEYLVKPLADYFYRAFRHD